MPSRSAASPPKYQKIINDLLWDIQEGRYNSNDQLPAERELADHYKVARATARRALTDLTAMGLTVRRGRRGTLLVSRPSGQQMQTLNLVCNAESLSLVGDFLRYGVETAEKMGWGFKITRVAANDELTTWQALALGTRHLILAAGFETGLGDKIMRAVARAADRTVVLGTRLDDSGISSVVCDDTAGVGMALNRLRSLGHRKIALVAGGEKPNHVILSNMVGKWRTELASCMTEKEFQDCLLPVEHLPFQDLSLRARDVVANFLRGGNARGVTAYLCLYEELANGTLAACRQAGLSVPRDVSVAGYAITERCTLRFPPISGISVQMDTHVYTGVQLFSENSRTPLVREIAPVFIEGGTIAAAAPTA